MPISKPDFNLIFASQAPSQDLPAAFNNYARGWDEARKNNGKPTIKQFNYLIQQLDLKALWMIQNGAALPFDETVDYAEGAFTVKDGSLQQFIAGVWKKPTQTADQIFDESGKTQQEVNDLFKVKLDKYLLIEDFGGDITGINPSDAALTAGLAASTASGLPLIINGKVRITKTVNQPQNSIVYCGGIVFCTDPSDLTDGWMWDVNHGGSITNTTEITRLILSASDSASTLTNRNMKGLRVRSASVRVGTVETYGCLDAGVEFGPTGYEIFADVVSCNIGAYSTNLGAIGLRMSTTDCGVQNVTTMGYPIGAHLGSANFADNVHVWGFPATTNASEFANKQMLTAVIVGSATRVNYIYADTPDTLLYDTPVAENAGVALVFAGWESSVGELYVRVHHQTKANKIKLIRYKGYGNSIEFMHPTNGFDTANPIVCDSPDLLWRNNITYSTRPTNITNFSFDVGALLPTGVTQASGTMGIRKQGRLAIIYFYYAIQAVDTSVAGDFKIPLPAGLSAAVGTSAVLTIRSCLAQHPSAVGGVDFATINGSSQIIIRQRNAESGMDFIFKNSQLRVGALELGITVSIPN